MIIITFVASGRVLVVDDSFGASEVVTSVDVAIVVVAGADVSGSVGSNVEVVASNVVAAVVVVDSEQ